MSPSEANQPDMARRFGGVARVYGEPALQRFLQSHICVIGLGGVGSWVVEALARSAVGKLTLIDLDHVHESNINRQLQASESTLGQSKAEALKQRIALINPECQVSCIDDFISEDNLSSLLLPEYDWVIDCIDNFRAKSALIAYCKRNKIRVITVGGAGGMIDATRIVTADLTRSKQDPLLSRVRRELRYSYGFSKDPAKRFSVPCVYSDEPLRYPAEDGGISPQKPGNTTGLNCAAGFGSAVTVTASFGMIAAGFVLNHMARSAAETTSESSVKQA